MFGRKKIRPVGYYYDKVFKRIANQSSTDLLEWADNSGTMTSKHLNDFRRSRENRVPGIIYLVDAKKELESNLAIIDTLIHREIPLTK